LCLKIIYTFTNVLSAWHICHREKWIEIVFYDGDFADFSLCFCFDVLHVEIILRAFKFRIARSSWLIKLFIALYVVILFLLFCLKVCFVLYYYSYSWWVLDNFCIIYLFIPLFSLNLCLYFLLLSWNLLYIAQSCTLGLCSSLIISV